jgi:hypothetical protein
MIFLIVAIERFVAQNWLDFSDPVSLSWRFSAVTAHTAAPGRDLLCLGDSLAKHGLIPSVIEKESGLRSVNLAAARCPTLMTYFLFRRALDAGAHPRAIILNSKPAVLIGGVDYNARYWREVSTLWECVELFGVCRRGELLASTLLGRLLPSLRSRLEVRSNLMAALRGQTDQLHDINRVLWRNWTVNDGANLASLHSAYQGALAPDIEEKLHPGVFHVDRSNIVGIERLLRLASARNIPVYWLLPPLAPALQARRDQTGAEAKFERFVRSFQERYSHVVTVLDARRGSHAPAMFVDATHLSGQGALALSHAVGKALRAQRLRTAPPDARRWIELSVPTGDPHAEVDLALEDIEQSKRFLHLYGDSGRSLR